TRNKWHKRFGVAARHGSRFAREQAALIGVQHCGGAGLEGGVDGKNAHDRVSCRSPPQMQRRPDRNQVAVGRTSTTSGTKCRNRFWMPCRSVAVDEGQPEQAPFMSR